MSIRFLWEYKYSVGNSKIDEQHRSMFEIANELDMIVSLRDVKTVIIKLFKYTREHFSYEEKMMEAIKYPALREHQEAHEKLITKLSEISTHSFDSQDDFDAFKEFIYNWLINHILDVDQRYCKFKKKEKREFPAN